MLASLLVTPFQKIIVPGSWSLLTPIAMAFRLVIDFESGKCQASPNLGILFDLHTLKDISMTTTVAPT